MKFFSKNEFIAVFAIFLVVFFVTFKNLQIAQRRARDAQRRSDLGAISNALQEYYEIYGFFPLSEEGKIKACKGKRFNEVLEELKKAQKFDSGKYLREAVVACEWGKDPFTDLLDEDRKDFLKTISSDPKTSEGDSYLYFSNTKRFQLYASLEGEETETGYDAGIVKRNLYCGNSVCSFGKTFGETALDKSIEEYEQELFLESKTGNH